MSIESFRQQCLDAHNLYRKRHGVPALTLDSQINQVSQNWANTCAARDTWMDSGSISRRQYGENIYVQYACVTREPLSGSKPVAHWYGEEKKFRYGQMEFSPDTGRFTQVVWKSTTKMGVGRATAASGNIYVVVNYSPFGNVLTQFASNVLKPRPVEDNKEESQAGAKEPVKEPAKEPEPANDKFDQFSRECLAAHNEYRRRHGSPPLALSEWLMGVAQDWANTVASHDRMFHSNHPNDCENIIGPYRGMTPNGRHPADTFYSEVQYYRYGSMGFTMQTGHFTQMVWKSTKLMGVGRAYSRSGGLYVVVSYSPRGNVTGQFASNVLPPRG